MIDTKFVKYKNIRTKHLSKSLINNICNLKDSHWKFGLSSQKKWFIRNNKKNDLHNLLFYKKELVGYTILKKKKIYYGKNNKYYLLFDTLIINKKYRNLKLSHILMRHNNSEIKKSDYCSFLLCNKKLIKFYKKFLWKNVHYKIKIVSKNGNFQNKRLLSYNLNNKNFKKNVLIIKI